MLQTMKHAAIVLLALLVMGSAAMADDVTFTGDVAYRERMALPPDATLVITLVNLPDQRRITGATATLPARSGSPIQFTLNVRSNVLAHGGAYGLNAEIRSNGFPIFASAQPITVDPMSPTGILIPVMRSPAPPETPILPPVETPNPLVSVVWKITSIGSDPVLPASELTFSIAADYRAGGKGGCNNYFTEASINATSLSFGPVAATRMACDPTVMKQEARYFAALAATAGYDLSGNTLKLLDAAGIPLVGLVRAP